MTNSYCNCPINFEYNIKSNHFAAMTNISRSLSHFLSVGHVSKFMITNAPTILSHKSADCFIVRLMFSLLQCAFPLTLIDMSKCILCCGLSRGRPFQIVLLPHRDDCLWADNRIWWLWNTIDHTTRAITINFNGFASNCGWLNTHCFDRDCKICSKKMPDTSVIVMRIIEFIWIASHLNREYLWLIVPIDKLPLTILAKRQMLNKPFETIW